METLASLTNQELLARLPILCSNERKATAEVIVYLAEVGRRRLYLDAACSSLHSFCIERLGYSEEAAIKRMRVARLYLRLPRVLDELKNGAIHLTGLFLLANHLTADNVEALLVDARGKTRREIECVLACWFPKPDVLPTVVPLGSVPETLPGSAGSATCPKTGESATCPRTGETDGRTGPAPPPGPRAHTEPLSARSYRVEFTASAEFHAKLEHVQNLLSHAVGPGALAEIFERALDELIAVETKRRQGVASDKPRKRRRLSPGSRHIPVDVAREVWNRDGYQCTFVDGIGRRCSEKRYLTLEHVDPHARGGPPTAENLCLLCDPHNQDAARREFGEEHMERKQREAEAYSKAAQALIALGFRRKQASAALDTLRRRGAALALDELLRQALALLCPRKEEASRPKSARVAPPREKATGRSCGEGPPRSEPTESRRAQRSGAARAVVFGSPQRCSVHTALLSLGVD